MQNNDSNETALLTTLRSKDVDSRRVFSTLVKKYSPALYWHIRRITKNHEISNDVLQNVWIKVWQHLDQFQGDSAFFTWIYRIARNEALNTIKKEQRHLTLVLDGPLVELIPGQKHIKEYSGEEISLKLQAAIASLPEKQGMVFELKYFDEMKYSEMSKLLNTSEGALKASYSIAVKKIQEFLIAD